MSGRTPRILVDTIPWLYYVLGDKRLSSHLREHLDKSAKHGKLFLSAASISECASMIKHEQLILQQNSEKWMQQALNESKTQVLVVDEHIAFESENLPKAPKNLHAHEKIILTSARNHNMMLVSEREPFKAYASTGFVKVKS